MAKIHLSKAVSHTALIEAIAKSDSLGLAGESYTFELPSKAFVTTAGMALMCAWSLEKKRLGHDVTFTGDPATVAYLSRMDLFKTLGIRHQESFQRHAEAGRFMPLRLLRNSKDCWQVVSQLGDLMLHQFDNAREFFPAMEWAVNEVMDNINIHSEAQVPGAVCAQFFPETHRVELGICDMGRGIKASLSERYELPSHEEAIAKALERGVTRDPEVGQGNGLAGTLAIAQGNEGTFHLWSGDACFKLSGGKPNTFAAIPVTAGTGIYLNLDTAKPVNLRSTFIGASQFGDNESTYIYSEGERVTSGDGLMITAECVHTGSRAPATALRRKIVTLLPEVESKKPLLLNFAGVTSASSSFLDELLSRLIVHMGEPQFKAKIKVINMTTQLSEMANVVIRQRLKGLADQAS